MKFFFSSFCVVLIMGHTSFTHSSFVGCKELLKENREEQQVIVWDLGGVLTEIDWMRYAYCIGYSSFLRPLLCDWKVPFDAKKRVFEFLNRINIPQHTLTKASGARIACGTTMPPLMVAFQAGILKEEEIGAVLKQELLKAEREGFFKSHSEKLMLERMSEEIFNPASVVFSYYLIPQGLELIRFLGTQKLFDGRKRYRLYVLSNWEPISFDTIHKELPDFFSYFDGIVVSGKIGLVKPSHAIFDHLVTTHNIDKTSCIFIDDQPENSEAARAYGIGTPLLFKDFKQLKRDLAQAGVAVPSLDQTNSLIPSFLKEKMLLFMILCAAIFISYNALGT